ncbi:GNAT family N-acetyltransferase [Silvimonas iriomotensis]|uniref:N-acetyltransferase n=1 Tax=Silvimonas iriomotensis TaxID=449662 RepID=A0ABQ2P8F8_9NEIS|nr:GNAT family N-acetyltransferase [Silvimonas iriomotensis]GGP20490.1 N-acetyltransferase [Silvimonas iriomotensis]
MTHIERHSDPRAFANDLGAWLGDNYAIHNQLYNAVLRTTVALMVAHERRLYLVKRGTATVGACMSIGPAPRFSLMITDLDAAACAALAAELAHEGITPTDIVGPAPDARRLAGLYAQDHRIEVHTALGNFQLQRQPVTTGAAGQLRPATAADRAWLLRHWIDFAHEAHIPEPDELVAERIAAQLESAVQTLWIWQVDGVDAAFCAGSYQPPLSRIGPVYTLPAHRGRGYAGAMVAAVSEVALGRGIKDLFLSTDLANPTSNAVYKRIGYVQIGEHLHLRLLADTATVQA